MRTADRRTGVLPRQALRGIFRVGSPANLEYPVDSIELSGMQSKVTKIEQKQGCTRITDLTRGRADKVSDQ